MEIVKGRKIEVGQIVNVYKNLNRNCFSIQDPKTGLVIAYASTVTLKNVIYRVQTAGRKKTIEQNRRSVHAYIRGNFVASDQAVPDRARRIGYYNPFKTETFIDEETGESITSSLLAHCQDKRIYFE